MAKANNGESGAGGSEAYEKKKYNKMTIRRRNIIRHGESGSKQRSVKIMSLL